MSRVEITLPRLLPLVFVTNGLRKIDAEEIYAGAITGPDQLAAETMRVGGVQWIAWLDGTPVCSFGAAELWPRVWNVWMYATEAWPGVALSVTKHVKRVLIPELLARGGHRGQCASLATHEEAHMWLQSFGFEREGLMRGYGRQGEDFIMFGWRKP